MHGIRVASRFYRKEEALMAHVRFDQNEVLSHNEWRYFVDMLPMTVRFGRPLSFFLLAATDSAAQSSVRWASV
jgi:hypothetical protein